MAATKRYRIDEHTHTLVLEVRSTQKAPLCPSCARASTRVHSRYTRTLADLPWAEVAVRVELSVRTCFCPSATCSHTIFCERVPSIARPWARRTRADAKSPQASARGYRRWNRFALRCRKKLRVNPSDQRDPRSRSDFASALPAEPPGWLPSSSALGSPLGAWQESIRKHLSKQGSPAIPSPAISDVDAARQSRVLGALEPGRAYTVVARSGLSWAQLNVAGLLAPPNLVWVRAEEVPELRVAAAVADLATPLPTIAPQVILVAAPGAPASAPAMRAVAPAGTVPLLDTAVPQPSPAPVYLIPPATPVVRPIVMRPIPTAPPCRLHELGSVLRICNSVTP